METHVNAHQLEQIVRDIREHERRLEGESIDEFMKRTWGAALVMYETNRAVLPRVQAQQERSERARESQGRLKQPTNQSKG